MTKRYYEGHEVIYKKLREKDLHSWDEFRGEALNFESFYLKSFVEIIFEHCSFSKPVPLVLEVGCGTGPVCCFFAQKNYKVEGVDVSNSAILIAKEEAKNRKLEVSYRVNDICQDILPSQKYDLVVDGHCLHCIVTIEDRKKAFSNIRQSMALKGYFAMQTMVRNEETVFDDGMVVDEEGILWQQIPTPSEYNLERQFDGKYYVATRRIFSEQQLKDELLQAGFSMIWSNVVFAENSNEIGDFQAICTLLD